MTRAPFATVQAIMSAGQNYWFGRGHLGAGAAITYLLYSAELRGEEVGQAADPVRRVLDLQPGEVEQSSWRLFLILVVLLGKPLEMALLLVLDPTHFVASGLFPRSWCSCCSRLPFLFLPLSELPC